MKLKGAYAVVTGASTGIGRAIAIALAKEKAFIALVARREEELKETTSLVEKVGGRAQIFVTDLSDLSSINKLISQIKNNTQRIDALVNVAGVWHSDNEVYASTALDAFSQKTILDTYSVGLTAPTLLAHALIPLMNKGAVIVNISGTFESGAKGWLPYYVSKRAIEDLTVGLAEQLKEKGISVNAISPSDTATEAYKKYFPQYMNDAITPEEIAQKAVRLCSDESGVTGKVFVMKKGEEPYEGFHS